MKMKVIFLDVDWVLVEIPNEQNVKAAKEKFWTLWYWNEKLFSKKAWLILKWLLEETWAKIVMSSSWRYSDSLMEVLSNACKNIWFNIQDYIIWRTKRLEWWRWEEIEDFVKWNKIEHFVILDDCSYKIDTNEFVNEHFILTDWYECFSEEDKKKAIEILKIKKNFE